jgi:glycosyltransferase involved in cell wall biosynthesis
MSQKPHILFICNANSTHAQGWINLLKDSPFEGRVFTTRLPSLDFGWAPDWNFPTYVTIQPAIKAKVQKVQVFWLLPGALGLKTVSNWLDSHFDLTVRYLRRTIRAWKPDIVHSLSMEKAGRLARLALQGIPPEDRPRWVVSSYGNDICLDLLDADKSKNIKSILAQCDGFMADCQRDRQLAVTAGLEAGKLALKRAVPGPGGLDLDQFARLRHAEPAPRRLILVPKAFEREHANRTLVILEAFRILGNALLKHYDIHLNMCSANVKAYLRQMPDWLQQLVHCHDMLPQDELFTQMAQARVVIAPSLTDGTPNVMLEAMAAGALPVLSPIDSIQEWITDGENGLLAHALYPDQVAAAVRRALLDDDLFDRAQRLNWEIVCQRADRREVRREVLEYYQNLYHPRKHG